MGKLLKIIGYTFATLFVALALAVLVLSLPFSGWRMLSVQTGSMRPAIGIGSLVFVHHVPATSLTVGDVITYKSRVVSGETITHRIIAFKQAGIVHEIVVKGDANKAADPPLVPDQVVGKVVKVVPHSGYVTDYLHKPLGLIAFIYIPALLIVFYEIKLAVQRLTQLEVDKRMLQQTASPAEPKPALEQTERPAVPKPIRHKRTMDGLGALFLVVLVALTVHATYSLLVSRAKLTGIKVSTIMITPGKHPTSIFDCILNGYKRFGFKNVGQCVVYVVQHQPHPPVPTPPTFPPIPTPKPPVIPTPVIPSPPITHHDATPSPSQSPSPSPKVSPSPAH